MSQPCLPIRRKRGNNEVEKSGFDDLENIDGAEYLARVVKQAKTFPEFLVASKDNNETNEMPKILRDHIPIEGSAASLSYLISGRASLTPPPTKDHLPKNQAWIEATINNFEKLQTYLENCKKEGIGGKKTDRIPFPQMKDRSGWHIFCVGKDDASGNVNSYFGGEDDDCDANNDDTLFEDDADLPEWRKAGIPVDGHSPSVQLLCQMDQVLIRRVLSHLSHYVCEGWSPLTPQRSSWIYALLARLEKPVHRDDAAVLFGLLKVLTLARSKVNADDRDGLSRLNTLIVLIGIYYEQGGGVVMTLEA